MWSGGSKLEISGLYLLPFSPSVNEAYKLILIAASLSNVGQLFGSLMMGVLAGAIGRKKTIMIFCLPLLIGWVIVGISEGKTLLLCLGRIFQGIGTMSSVTQVYLVEVADAQRR